MSLQLILNDLKMLNKLRIRKPHLSRKPILVIWSPISIEAPVLHAGQVHAEAYIA
jgi:hypothetical protein